MVFTINIGDEKSALSESDSIPCDTALKPNAVRIGPHFIDMPLNKILLIRKNEILGAIKFTQFWTGRSESDKYASYDSWFQDDKSGDFSKKNVNFENRKASSTLWGIGRFSFNFGNEEIRCGIFRLWWWGEGTIYFFSQGQDFNDYGIEFAPTKWTKIENVNVFDPHLKWYRYDKNRPCFDLPVEGVGGTGT